MRLFPGRFNERSELGVAPSHVVLDRGKEEAASWAPVFWVFFWFFETGTSFCHYGSNVTAASGFPSHAFLAVVACIPLKLCVALVRNLI